MSTTYRKVEFECECGRNYGRCEETGKFFLVYHGVSDLTDIYYHPHPSDKLIHMGCFDDKQIEYLGILITSNFDTLAKCDSEEIGLILNDIRY